MPFDPKSLNLFPDQPGVYLMKDASARVLYIGKAKNIQRRLKQYFHPGQDEREMVPILVEQIETIEPIVTLTEKDALILENNLIKRHQPKYNVLLKDDKTFISLLLTEHKWPMLRLVRNKGKPTVPGNYFGPYTNALAARQTFDLILRLFPLRQCSDAEFSSRKRPCLLHDMKRCPAPCVGKCSQEAYRTLVQGALRLLKGQDKEVVKELRSAMEEASQKLEFEKAQDLLKLIHQIEHVTSVQHVDNPMAKDCDVLGLYRQADAVLIALLEFREGKIIGSEHFSFHLIAENDVDALESFILQHYRLLPTTPPEILTPFDLPHRQEIDEILSEAHGKKITLIAPKKGKKRDLLEMAERNAKALFLREQDERSLTEKMLLDLQETLELTRFPRCIECLDTAHISGTDPVASICAFLFGKKDKSRTRHFKIKQANAADDYASLKEVLLRHLSRQKAENNFCDLLIVDGGKGQLNCALEVFEELGIASIDLIALTKESARHDKGLTQEKVYLPHTPEPIWIDPHSPMLFLLQRIRDEAHRQAITFHRKRRSKRTFVSELDDLEGIGPVKRQKLLSYFGSVRAIKAASKENLQQVDGLTNRDIRQLIKFISSESKE